MEYIYIGKIVNTHGIKGELRILSDFPFKDKVLTEKITKIIQGAHYSGPFCIEFLVGPDDNLYFLEVNFRHSGWGYAFTYGGFNLPVRWASATLDNEIILDDFFYKVC